MPGESIPLTEFVSGTASEHVCRLVPVASPQMTARELRQSLEGVHFESVAHVGVCDDGKLIGVLRVEELFSALPDVRVGEVMDADPPVIAPGFDQEKAAWKAVQHGEGDRLQVTGDWTPATAAGKRFMGRTITTWERVK
jgi:magnesium transporter